MRDPTMSKMDALRAMREARYEQRTAGARKAAAAPQPVPAQPVPVPAKAPRPTPVEDEPASAGAELPEERLCGHRAISGRTCTREAGHTAKSHRYA